MIVIRCAPGALWRGVVVGVLWRAVWWGQRGAGGRVVMPVASSPGRHVACTTTGVLSCRHGHARRRRAAPPRRGQLRPPHHPCRRPVRRRTTWCGSAGRAIASSSPPTPSPSRRATPRRIRGCRSRWWPSTTPYDQLLLRGRVVEVRQDDDLRVLDALAQKYLGTAFPRRTWSSRVVLVIEAHQARAYRSALHDPRTPPRAG